MTALHGNASSATLRTSAIVIASAAAWGCWWIPLRRIDALGFSGDWASLAVLAVAAICLTPLLVRRGGHLRRAGPMVWGTGLFFGAMFATYQHGLITGDIVRVTLLFYLAPVWGTLLAMFVLGARFSLTRLAVIVLGFAGAAVILGFAEGVPMPRGLGEWMGLASGITFAIGATFAHKVKGDFEFEKTWLSFVFGAGFAALFIVANPVAPAPNWAEFLAVVPVATITVLLMLIPITWAMVWGAQRLDPGRVSLLLMFEVIAASVSASLLAGEPYGSEKLIGTVMILSAGAIDTFGSAVQFRRRSARTRRASDAPGVAPDRGVS